MKHPLRLALLAVSLVLPLALSGPHARADQAAAPAKVPTLYERVGGYDAISAVVEELVARLAADDKVGRFWAHRGEDGIRREKQLVKSFIAEAAGGPIAYPGRTNPVSHKGMRIDAEDWKRMMAHLDAILTDFKVPPREHKDVMAFIDSTRKDIVEKK
ncbi:MAG: group 1 truncated hemoglobin [Rhodobacterales bacterium]|nr:group 1 truncated hemoglobin [Rhodobacterales bacterium]